MTASNNEDRDMDFREAMEGLSGVKRLLTASTPVINKKLRIDPTKGYLREQATKLEERVIDHLSSEAVDIIESDAELLFVTPGVQLRLVKRLRQGHIPWEAGLDLHGYTVEQAREMLSSFVRDGINRGYRSLLVVHGKAFSQSGSQPILKSYVYEWLKRFPEVLAFCSAQAIDGGTGALYILLRRKNEKR